MAASVAPAIVSTHRRSAFADVDKQNAARMVTESLLLTSGFGPALPPIASGATELSSAKTSLNGF
ncbi:hypothetical protein [Mycobacterium colombiense]